MSLTPIGQSTPTRLAPVLARLRNDRRLHLGLGLIGLWVLLLRQWAPLDMWQISPGLDASWAAMLGEAAGGRYGFGSDIVFTGGPLSVIYTRYFVPAFFPTYLWTSYTLLFAIGVALSALFMQRPQRSSLVLLLAALLLVYSRDVWLIFPPFATALASFGHPSGRRTLAVVLIGAFGTAIATLAKFSVLPAALVCFVLIDVQRISRRTLPAALPCFLLSFYGLFLLVAPASSDFGLYLAGSLDTSAGYAAAMSSSGPAGEVMSYLMLCLVATGGAVLMEYRRLGWAWLLRIDDVFPLLTLLLILWLGLKAGFTRHDSGHVAIAFGIGAVAIVTYAAARGPSFGRSKLVSAVVAALMIYSMLGYLIVQSQWRSWSATDFIAGDLVAWPGELSRTAFALTAPHRWYEALLAGRQAAIAATATTDPVRDIHGSIASVVSLQSTLLAVGADFRPQPTVQEYTSYTHDLIARDRAFYESVRPDYILFSPEAIDGRYPAFAEGSLWPFFLTNYAPVKIIGGLPGSAVNDLVLLKRRMHPLEQGLGPWIEGGGELNRSLLLPAVDKPLFASVDVHLSLLGQIANFIFKTPPIFIEVTRRDGVTKTFRFIPGIAREGFLISPTILGATDFALLGSSEWDRTEAVTSMKISASRLASLFYKPQLGYRTAPLDVAGLADAAKAEDLTMADLHQFSGIFWFKELVRENGGPNQNFRMIPEGMFAHPPRRISVPLRRAGGELSLDYGVLDGAWSAGGDTDGVCFRLLDGSSGQALWENCLTPKTVAADRGEHHAAVKLPPTARFVVLETDCRSGCSWDWAYWSHIGDAAGR